MTHGPKDNDGPCAVPGCASAFATMMLFGGGREFEVCPSCWQAENDRLIADESVPEKVGVYRTFPFSWLDGTADPPAGFTQRRWGGSEASPSES